MSSKPFPWDTRLVSKSPFGKGRDQKEALIVAKSKEKAYKQGESIGFTYVSSLKSMGRIPRANGLYERGLKYTLRTSLMEEIRARDYEGMVQHPTEINTPIGGVYPLFELLRIAVFDERDPDFLPTSTQHIDTLKTWIQQGLDVRIQENNETPLVRAVRLNNLRTVSTLIQAGAEMYGALSEAATECNMEMVMHLLRNGVHVDTPNVVKIVIDQCPSQLLYEDVMYALLSNIARMRPSRDDVLIYLDWLIRLDDTAFFGFFVKALGIDVSDLVEISQESSPRPMSEKVYPRSGRAITQMKRLLTTPPREIRIQKEWNVEINDTCFCLDVPIGEYTDMYVPVTRYGQTPGTGFYGTGEYHDPMFTWYYVEPDSDFVLYAPRTFVARNKFQAFLLLSKGEYKSQESFVVSRIIDYMNDHGIYGEPIDPFLESDEVYLDDITTFFRNPTTGEIFFEEGAMDFLDDVLSEMIRQKGYDVLVLTHQPGNYDRLVSECLDVRTRTTSFANIYKVTPPLLVI
jgi:hypothetical protein